MKSHKIIRFVGTPQANYYYLKLGPMEAANPPEREFSGGDEEIVIIEDTSGKPECADITFANGECALEVPREFFEVLTKVPGR